MTTPDNQSDLEQLELENAIWPWLADDSMADDSNDPEPAGQPVFDCAHCDEPSEVHHAATPTCPHCGRDICPCCSVENCMAF